MDKLEALLFLIGMVLSLGSIATFIVMNVAVGSSLDATLIHHQRLLVAAASRSLTIPGVCMLLAATILSMGLRGHYRFIDGRVLAQLILAALIFANTMIFIRPLLAEVSRLAAQGAAQGRLPDSYLRRKKLEDRFGTANFLMLVTMLLLAAFRP